MCHLSRSSPSTSPDTPRTPLLQFEQDLETGSIGFVEFVLWAEMDAPQLINHFRRLHEENGLTGRVHSRTA